MWIMKLPDAQVDGIDSSDKNLSQIKSSLVNSQKYPLCTASQRPDQHHLSVCTYLQDKDHKYMTKARQILSTLQEDTVREESGEYHQIDPDQQPTATLHFEGKRMTIPIY